ncbi:hypothetical protein ACFVWN_16895 [Nocardiopsis flavescens]|uniref:Uncharacterized protein n=1 Tax=Nocardiopsis flavescens TaxID=758803 RepID=A0A1M6V6B6_9ACTN|nr:hypothetical protein [Nocardiopsis flavescens]SHK76990.1 hypothetical protein SAMN05421803_13217 [Nocardiopsis flavescens]
MRSGSTRLAFAACALLAVAGCSEPATETGGTTAETASPSSSAAGDEEAALAAYTGMWDAVTAASHGDEDASRALDDHAVGGARELMRTALDQAAAGGAAQGEPVIDPVLTVESRERAVVADCVDDSAWRTGGAPGAAGSRKVDATLIHDGLAWRVSELRIWEAGSC